LQEHSVTRLPWLNLAVLCVLAAFPDPAQGCRYNVREIGFIDVGIEPYRLFVYVPQAVGAGEIGNLKNALDAACADTNIRCEPVPEGADANHPALPFLSAHRIDSYPAAVIVSPDGPSRRLPLHADGQSLTEAVSSSLEAALDSPIRRQILEKAADSYAVVLLIEGPQQDRNTAAREAVSAAISYVSEQLQYLPKPIAKGPEMVVLDQSSLAGEETLLWTLGLAPGDVNEPCAAIFYGRGRWIGPLFKGAVLTDANLLRVLPAIGADCECGLDHRWLQGTMLPARWDESLQQKVAASLGFDPDSPIVKMEMVSIIRRGMGGFDDPGAPFGYQEIVVGGERASPSSASAPEFNDVPVESEVKPLVSVAPQTAASLADVERPWRGGFVLAVSFGGMVVLVAAVSAVILLRAKRD